MNKYLLSAIASFLCTFAAISSSSAQSALFIYDDNSGTANAGTYTAGSSFSFSINLAFTPGGSVSNLEGLSYWFQQASPTGSPFNFAITLRDLTGSPFTDPQASLTYPQNLNPSNPQDLGALLPTGQSALGAGTYLVATLTVSIDASAAAGSYTLSNTISGGKISIITDSNGNTFNIPESDYFLTVVAVPEPATWAAGGLLFATLLGSQWRKIFRFRAIA
jgi:hypothetical protein